MGNSETLNSLPAHLLGELLAVSGAVRARGPRHYARPLGVAVAIVFGAYQFLFLASGERLARVQGDLVAAKATAQYADTFRELDERLRLFSERLPPPQNADQWLLDTVRESMREEEIFSTSLSPVVQTSSGRFRFLTLSITCRASYAQLAGWVARMERSRQLLHISSLAVKKDPQEVGLNDVTVTISSLIPRDGGAQ